MSHEVLSETPSVSTKSEMLLLVFQSFLYVCNHMVGALQFPWTYLVYSLIVIDVGNMPQYFIPDITDHHILHSF